jgi:tetratricopeptide (TPR) repeat protein
MRSSSAELDSWLSQEIQDELGTRAYILRAIAWCRRGQLARARADVDAALAKVPPHELIELCGAMILYVTRDYDRAIVLLDDVARRHRYMAAQALRELAARAARLGWTQEQREAQRRLAALGVRDLRAHIRGLQQRRGQQRGVQAAGALALEAEQAWARLYEFGPQEVRARLDDLAGAGTGSGPPGQAGSPEIAAMRARLCLLEGELDAADEQLAGFAEDEPALFEERLALALARGCFEEVAAAELVEGHCGARAWRLQAEALLELGRHEQAQAALDRAAALEPEHPLLELLRLELARAQTGGGPGGGPGVEPFDALYARAPGLLSDAARELGVTLWGDGGLRAESSNLAEVCTRARAMLCADRSSAPVSYRTISNFGSSPGSGPESGPGRSCLRHLDRTKGGTKVHAEDAADLAKVAQLLLRSLEKHRGEKHRGEKHRGEKHRGGAHRATATRSLSTDQIEQFMVEGYVHLRGAFPRELAESIVAGAHRRLREDPRRWLAGKQAEPRAAELAGYHPEDPSTWPEGRLDILGERKFTMSEFSPFAERAVFQLLGDAARIRTRSWTSNLIAQYPRRVPVHSWVPTPDQESWHLDSPSTHTRLDQLHTGLLVFIVFSDLLPASGNTWLALDSPAKVARTLAAAPEGVDFCSDEAGPAITRTCERFFELTGEAGDLLLVHPLMLHSASPNPSPRIRFLGNPMVYMQEPLDYRRADASPVERLIARALS